MKFVTIGRNRHICEVPSTWAEAEEMITKAVRYHDKRGGNLAVQSVCARVAYGMFGEIWLAAEPTQALAYLLQRICQRKGAGLEL